MIYFDNAATSGVKPKEVIGAVDTALRHYSANAGRSGHQASVKTAEAVFTARQKAAEFFGCKAPENVIFTASCTHSINCVLKGVLKRGDHVIISSLEHNAVVRPLKKLGLSFDIAPVSIDSDEETVYNFKKRIRPNTRLIFCTAASNVIGKILPIEKLGALCKSRGILFAVDAAQGAGVMPIDMQKMNIDYLCVAPHKGLYAPMGIGILLCNKPIENTVLEGGTGTNSLDLLQPQDMPEKHESGTLNVPAIFGVSAGIDFVSKTGISKIYNHEMMLINYILGELKNNGKAVVYTPDMGAGAYMPVLSFNLRGKHSEETARFLSENGIAVRGGYHCAPLAHAMLDTLDSGTVRVSVGAFNSKSEAERFINIINNINFNKKY